MGESDIKRKGKKYDSALTGKSGLRRYYDSLRSKGINHDNAYNAVSRKIAAISLSV